jgi:hypothetical protein
MDEELVKAAVSASQLVDDIETDPFRFAARAAELAKHVRRMSTYILEAHEKEMRSQVRNPSE